MPSPYPSPYKPQAGPESWSTFLSLPASLAQERRYQTKRIWPTSPQRRRHAKDFGRPRPHTHSHRDTDTDTQTDRHPQTNAAYNSLNAE
jgi:hypothetical protein